MDRTRRATWLLFDDEDGLHWLLTGTAAVITPPTIPGAELRLSPERMHYQLASERMHYALSNQRMHYRVEEET